MSVIKLVFSKNRPLQLWGLVQSILDNTDLAPDQIVCVCKSSDRNFRKAYEVVQAELGCSIIHEENSSRRLSRLLFGRKSLYKYIMELIQGSEFVSLAVDDMFYFREASFGRAAETLKENPEICLWSWRIGADLQPYKGLRIKDTHWIVPHATASMPYRYIFHTDGSVFRREDLEYWLQLIPERSRKAFNLNQIEGYLARYSDSERDNLKLGKLHAGPLIQACVTWQINKVSTSGGGGFCEVNNTNTPHLLEIFERGGRLDYSPLYQRSDWLIDCNEDWGNPPTHVAPTEQASELWSQMTTESARKAKRL